MAEYSVPNYMEQGSTGLIIGGKIDIISGGSFEIESIAVTASAAELNKTDGLTATTAQLNFLSGVTAGTAAASKALVLDANLDVASVRRFTVSNWVREPTETVVSTVLTTGAVKKPAWSDLTAYGHSDLSASGSSGGTAAMAFKLPHPGVSGVRKALFASVSSTAKPCTVETRLDTQWIGGGAGSTAATNHRIVLTQPGDYVELISASSVQWRLTNNVGAAVLSTDFTT
jgi:hypothetical protein